MKVGVLALQGDVIEHARILEALGVTPVEVRTPHELVKVDGLIIPGGESTTMGKLLQRNGLDRAIKRFSRPIYGTCAGLILLAKDVEGDSQPTLGMLDISVKRNDYGSQLESFEAKVHSKISQRPLNVAFIRAPVITRIGKDVQVLADYGKRPVLIRQGNILSSTFHPEICGEKVVHRFFLKMVENR